MVEIESRFELALKPIIFKDLLNFIDLNEFKDN